MKNQIVIIVTTLMALASFAVCPATQAVVPPPDGGYPNFTTAEGTNALKNLASGAGNTGIGWFSLFSDTTASFNTAVGVGTLLFNNGDENTAIGAATLLFNTASGNTAIGSRALLNNTAGGTVGNIQGIDVGPNVAVGQQALESNTVASANTAVGYQVLHSFTTGPVGFEQFGLCTAVGFRALGNATGGLSNSGFGYQALMNNTDGANNTAVGLLALFDNTTGSSNVAIGNNALVHNDTGDNNTGVGLNALESNISGSENTAIGFNAFAGGTGSGNTVFGGFAADTVVGDNNTVLGFQAGGSIGIANNVICIGANVAGQTVSDSCYIGNIFNATSSGGSAVFVNANGKLGTTVSSRRFKEEIKPMDKASEAILALKPVTFHYKSDNTHTPQFGLIAEEVKKVNPDLVVPDKEGKPYSVRYDQVNAMLLNEFLKEHKKVEEQQATIIDLKSTESKQEATIAKQEKTITDLTKGMEVLTAQLKQQAAQIQKVSARVEMSRPAPKFVSSNP